MQTVCNTYWDVGKSNLTAQNTRKPFVGRSSAPDPAGTAYSAPVNPHPRSRPFGPRLSYPHSKISSDAVVGVEWLGGLGMTSSQILGSNFHINLHQYHSLALLCKCLIIKLTSTGGSADSAPDTAGAALGETWSTVHSQVTWYIRCKIWARFSSFQTVWLNRAQQI